MLLDRNPLDILLVEDNPGDARLVTEGLKEARADEIRINHVDRLEKALEALSRGSVDAILLDLSLPDAEREDAIHRMRTAAPDTAIVVLTSLKDEKLILSAFQVGVQDYLIKGMTDPDLLARTLRYAVERKRVETQWLAERERSGRLDGALQAVRMLQHEVNNPLQALLGTLEILNLRLGEDARKHADQLERLKVAAMRIAEVVHRIGNLTRTESVESPIGHRLRLPDLPAQKDSGTPPPDEGAPES